MPKRSDFVYHRGDPIAFFEQIKTYYSRQYNKENTGKVVGIDPSNSPSVQWSYTDPGSGEAHGRGPAVTDDTIYISTRDYGGGGSIIAVNISNGTEKWKYTGNTALDFRGGVVANNDTVYSGIDGGDRSGELVALNQSDGSEKWSKDMGSSIEFSPTLDGEGNIYVVYDSIGGISKLLASDGTVQWSGGPGGDYPSSNITYYDGKLFYGNFDTNLYALDAADGSELWSVSFDNRPANVPAIDEENGNVIESDQYGYFSSINISDGTINWYISYDPSWVDEVTRTNIVYQNGYIYAGGDNGYEMARDASDGTVVWERSNSDGTYIDADIAITESGYGFFPKSNGTLYVIDLSDGSLLTTLDPGDSTLTSVVIKNGTAYVIGGSGYIYAVK